MDSMQPPANQQFYRGNDRILGGVCSGLAEGFHIDALWVRLGFVVLAFVQGIGILIYILLWVLMPQREGYQPAGQNAFDSMAADVKRAWAGLRAQFGGAQTASPAAAPAPGQTSPAPGQTAPAAAITTPAPVASEAVPPPPASMPPQPASRTPSFMLGAILVVIGVAVLAANTGFLEWSIVWPAALVVLGVVLLVRNLEKRSGQ